MREIALTNSNQNRDGTSLKEGHEHDTQLFVFKINSPCVNLRFSLSFEPALGKAERSAGVIACTSAKSASPAFEIAV